MDTNDPQAQVQQATFDSFLRECALHLSERRMPLDNYQVPTQYDVSACMRKIAFRRSDIEPVPSDLQSALSLYMASSVIALAAYTATAMWKTWANNIPWIGPIKGVTHGVYYTNDPDSTGDRIAVTFAPLHPYSMKSVVKSGPTPEHLMHAMMAAHYIGAPVWTIMHISKAAAQGDTATFGVSGTVDFNAVEREESRILSLDGVHPEDAPRRDMLNMLDPHTAKWPCGYCAYKTECIAIEGEAEEAY